MPSGAANRVASPYTAPSNATMSRTGWAEQHRPDWRTTRRWCNRTPAHTVEWRSRASWRWRSWTAAFRDRCRCRAAAGASFSPDAAACLQRVFREFRTGSGIVGAGGRPLALRLRNRQTRQLTDNPAQDLFRCGTADRIYFVSERDERARPICSARSADAGSAPAHHVHRIRRQVPLAGRRGHRVRERRPPVPL